ncbi:MAG: hypothetical protein P8Z50_03140 [candidate division WOR-3 bacterium]
MSDNIILSTGDIKREYELVDIIFAAQVIRSRWIRSGGRETLNFLSQLNSKLKEEAKRKGCDAVIWTDYDFDRNPNVQVLTAYGTGVKFKG